MLKDGGTYKFRNDGERELDLTKEGDALKWVKHENASLTQSRNFERIKDVDVTLLPDKLKEGLIKMGYTEKTIKAMGTPFEIEGVYKPTSGSHGACCEVRPDHMSKIQSEEGKKISKALANKSGSEYCLIASCSNELMLVNSQGDVVEMEYESKVNKDLIKEIKG